MNPSVSAIQSAASSELRWFPGYSIYYFMSNLINDSCTGKYIDKGEGTKQSAEYSEAVSQGVLMQGHLTISKHMFQSWFVFCPPQLMRFQSRQKIITSQAKNVIVIKEHMFTLRKPDASSRFTILIRITLVIKSS